MTGRGASTYTGFLARGLGGGGLVAMLPSLLFFAQIYKNVNFC